MGTRTGIVVIDAAARAGSSCAGEDVAVQNAGARLAYFQHLARQQAMAFAQQQAALAAQARAQQLEAARQRAEAARVQREAEARAAEEARAARLREQEEQRRAAELQRENAEWAVVDVKGCSERGDPRACDALARWIIQFPASQRQEEAAAALQAGRDRIAAVEAKEAEKARRERQRARAAAPPVTIAPASEAPAHVCCCDGSVSPTCTTVHRGCCSHHGGVCACQ